MGIRIALRKATQQLRFSDSIPACGNDWTTVFMLHKREPFDSKMESDSSLFYLLQDNLVRNALYLGVAESHISGSNLQNVAIL